MSAAGLAACTALELLDLLARAGLTAYLHGLGMEDEATVHLRQSVERDLTLRGVPVQAWPAQRDALLAAWAQACGPAATLARILDLAPPDLFVLALAGGCEQSGAVALAVAALQAPSPGSRPAVHLVLDMLDTLFDGAPHDAVTLAGDPLVTQGVLALEGEDALPLRVLALRLPLWAALRGGAPRWPGARPLPPAETGADANMTASAPGAQSTGTQSTGAQSTEAQTTADATVIVVRGPPGSGRAAYAASVAHSMGRAAIDVPAAVFIDDAGFASACVAAQWLPVLRANGGLDIARAPPLACVVLAGPADAVSVPAGTTLRDIVLHPPPPSARQALWREAMNAAIPANDAMAWDASAWDALGRGAMLHAPTIRQIAAVACADAARAGRAPMPADVARARQALAPAGLRRLAHPVPREVGRDAMIAADPLARDLDRLIERCRRRETVWDGLGPSLAASRNSGVRALFSGDSGTGKTLAASYVATALGAPLYRCDLAAVMNKYIGESEKNIGALLDDAQAADVILLFDEADSLFGRRTDGGETGERYANMLTNFLLTRIEAHGGVVLLTANGKSRIDPAFWRRLDLIIDFSAPGYPERLALWRSHLGARAPAESVLAQLAGFCDLAGGGIRNAVLAAAAAAPADGPIGPGEIAQALKREYAKIGRNLPAGLAMAPEATAAPAA